MDKSARLEIRGSNPSSGSKIFLLKILIFSFFFCRNMHKTLDSEFATGTTQDSICTPHVQKKENTFGELTLPLEPTFGL